MANHRSSHAPSTTALSSKARPALEAEIAEVRAALAEQRAAIAALQRAVVARGIPHATQPEHTTSVVPSAPDAPISEAEAPQPATAAPEAPKRASRRGLLRGAAAGAAAAAIATVAVGSAESAHAAPLATGGNLILGGSNNANATTILSPTSGSAPEPLLEVDNSANLETAILAFSQNPYGAIVGYATKGGTDIYGASDSGNGVLGVSISAASLNASGSGRIAQVPQKKAGAPTDTSTYFEAGEQIRDSNGELWLCTAGGQPGTWVRVAHVDVGASGGAITFLSKPIRLLDTRPGQSAAIAPGAKLTAGDHYFPVNGTNYNSVLVSNNATGIVGNLTVLNATASGYIAVCPANVGFSGTANLAFNPGQTLSNAYTTAVGVYIISVYPYLQTATGIDIYVNGASLDVIIDIMAIVL